MGQDTAHLDTLAHAKDEVVALRARTESVIGELDRRAHGRIDRTRKQIAKFKRAIDVRAHFSRHPELFIGTGVGLVVVSGILLYVGRSPKGTPFKQWRDAIATRVRGTANLLSHPERVAVRASFARMLFSGVVAATVGSILTQTFTALARSSLRARR